MESTIHDLFTNLGYAGILLAMAIESCCIPLPSELIMPLAGFMTVTTATQKASFNLVGVSLAGALGCLLGSIVAYLIGATGGRDLLLKYGKYILISRRDADRADAFFARHGDVTIFVSRILPVVRTFISLPAGISRTNFPRFVIFTFLGSLPWCFVLALIGQKLGENWRDVGGVLHKFDYLIVAIVLVLVVLYVRRHLREERLSAGA